MPGSETGVPTSNPLDPSEDLHQTSQNQPLSPSPGDSAVTKAERVEESSSRGHDDDESSQRPAKRARLEFSTDHDSSLEQDTSTNGTGSTTKQAEERGLEETRSRLKGSAPVKAEYLINTSARLNRPGDGGDLKPREDARDARDNQRQDKQKGQNTSRSFGNSRDAVQLCQSRSNSPEFSPAECRFGDNCKFEHDLRKYLSKGKRADIDTFQGRCPIVDARGRCSAGWRCRFASAHSAERTTEDGRQELILTYNQTPQVAPGAQDASDDIPGIVNVVSMGDKINLRKKNFKTVKADAYTNYLNKLGQEIDSGNNSRKPDTDSKTGEGGDTKDATMDNRAQYSEPPFLPSEKRRIYYGPETPVLAPLTTQGNLPFRRLCVELGAQATWSEMAMALPLIQGEKSEWALMKAHESELSSPKYSTTKNIVKDYDNSKDFRFGVQIAANKPWMALKATEIITSLCPHLRAIDLNCGCPIDLVYRQGAGSALLDSPGKLEKLLRGMNAVSGEVPITVKIRMGTSDKKPTADRLVERLAWGGPESTVPPGIAAITLHGRSRQQRYTRSADWSYIAQCAATIKQYNEERNDRTDTNRESDPRDENAQHGGKIFFLGNGDCYSHVDYYDHIDKARVDSVMVARGALVKPWIFEEIEKGQYLDKSSSERLRYIEQFARYGLETWGSDEIGLGTTRRFLLEWLSFACRYVPLGILEHLPPNIQDRPPAYRGRDDLETLLSSDNYKDWIKISEMFLGPAHPDFKFEPKHKSNSYEAEG